MSEHSHSHEPGDTDNHPFQFITLDHDCSTSVMVNDPNGETRVFADVTYLCFIGLQEAMLQAMLASVGALSDEDAAYWLGVTETYGALNEVAMRWRAEAEAQRALENVTVADFE